MTSVLHQPIRSNLVPGLWLIVAPFVFGVTGIALWNNVLMGAIIPLVGWYMYALDEGGKKHVTGSSVNTVLGLWVAVSPFLLRPGLPLLVNNVIVGILVALFDIHYP